MTNDLSFRELESLASALLAILLAFFDSRVARDKTGLLQASAKFGIEFYKRPRDAVTNCARLSCKTASIDIDQNVEFADRIGQVKRLTDDHAMHLVLKIVLKLALVYDNLSGSRS